MSYSLAESSWSKFGPWLLIRVGSGIVCAGQEWIGDGVAVPSCRFLIESGTRRRKSFEGTVGRRLAASTASNRMATLNEGGPSGTFMPPADPPRGPSGRGLHREGRSSSATSSIALAPPSRPDAQAFDGGLPRAARSASSLAGGWSWSRPTASSRRSCPTIQGRGQFRLIFAILVPLVETIGSNAIRVV